MPIRVVGIDCATAATKIGLALGEYFDVDNEVVVNAVRVCNQQEPPEEIIGAWLSEPCEPTLLAIDAPLGWPIEFAPALAGHWAGESIKIEPNKMFRRATDRFIHSRVGQRPLDVGADRIARTAHAALFLLAKVRDKFTQSIPLAWSATELSEFQAIEVYPAATLRAHGLPSKGYKSKVQINAKGFRSNVIDGLKSKMKICNTIAGCMKENSDALDAVVCLLAACDFLSGCAMLPSNPELARREGWIWCAEPLATKPRNARRSNVAFDL